MTVANTTANVAVWNGRQKPMRRKHKKKWVMPDAGSQPRKKKGERPSIAALVGEALDEACKKKRKFKVPPQFLSNNKGK